MGSSQALMQEVPGRLPQVFLCFSTIISVPGPGYESYSGIKGCKLVSCLSPDPSICGLLQGEPRSSFSIDPEILDSLNQPEIQRLHPWDGGKLRLWSKTVPSVSSPIFPVTQEHSWGQHAINALKGSSEAGAASSACCPDT